MKISFLLFFILIFYGCRKDKDKDDIISQAELEKSILVDFADVVVNPNYAEIQVRADSLEKSIIHFLADTTQINLVKARNSWKNVRESWEKCEAFLFGPVEDFNYDPEMDTWPLSIVEMDSLLAGSGTLTVADIEALPTSLRGFHAIEYIIFGVNGDKTSGQITEREKEYLLSLTVNLHDITSRLQNSWLTGNFSNVWKTAGEGSPRFPTRKDAFITLANSLAGICEEVGEGKMKEPLVTQDSSIEESQYSNNSTADFRNNMIGVKNAYFATYHSDGHGLNELVRLKNSALDQKIQLEINAVLTTFDLIDSNFSQAIFNQPVQVLDLIRKIETLRTTFEEELTPFLNTWVTN